VRICNCDEIDAPGVAPVKVEYDERGRPTTFTQGDRISALHYDEHGFVDHATDPASFAYGPAQTPVLMNTPSRVYRIIADHLGSVRLVVDATSGAIAQRIDYDEFGRVTQDTNPGFQPFGYAGGLYDPDTQLVHFGARD
jgi:YD repeat-containing protein